MGRFNTRSRGVHERPRDRDGTGVAAGGRRDDTAPMRAATIGRFGGPEEFTIADLPTPEPAAGQVLVRVAYAGVNPLDYKIRDGSSGLAKKLTDADFPLILGEECSGTVAALGAGVTGLAVGDRVFGLAPMTHHCYAEYVALPATSLARAPEHASLEPLGGLSIAGLTAWKAVQDLGRTTASDVVVVHGGGGGVGQLIVQLAVATGAIVYATASARHHDTLARWGAHPIDYATEDWRAVVGKPTVIIDGVYFGTYEPSIEALAPGDRLVVLPTLADLAPAKAKGLDVAVPSITPDRGRLERLAEEVESGALEVVVSAVYELGQVAEAHRVVEGGHAQGKVLLRIGG